MLDLSFTGGSIKISAPAMGGPTTITEFSDEGSPVEVDEIEVTGQSINLNGTLMRWRKPAAYTVKVSVIPLSNADASLTKLLEASHVRPSGNGVIATKISELNTTMTIFSPSLNNSGQGSAYTWTFSEGCILSGAPGVTCDAEGKIQAKIFSFVFERLKYSFEKGKELVAGRTSI